MANITTIDQAGRVVIPRPIRERYGLEAGSSIAIVAEEGRIVLIPTTEGPRVVEHGGLLMLELETNDGPVDHLTERTARIDSQVAYAIQS